MLNKDVYHALNITSAEQADLEKVERWGQMFIPGNATSLKEFLEYFGQALVYENNFIDKKEIIRSDAKDAVKKVAQSDMIGAGQDLANIMINVVGKEPLAESNTTRFDK